MFVLLEQSFRRDIRSNIIVSRTLEILLNQKEFCYFHGFGLSRRRKPVSFTGRIAH